jgi:hypothetical protein
MISSGMKNHVKIFKTFLPNRKHKYFNKREATNYFYESYEIILHVSRLFSILGRFLKNLNELNVIRKLHKAQILVALGRRISKTAIFVQFIPRDISY